VTTTPLQALTLLNNKFIEHYAARFAERLQREAPDPAAQVRRAYALAFARPPTAQPCLRAETFSAPLPTGSAASRWRP
jgi:hypothetical protein